MSAPTWQALRDAIEKMVAYPAGDGWHISREAADKALEWIKWAEVHQPYPVPKLLPEEDEDLSLVWRSVDGWAIYRTFPKGEEPYWLAMPSRTPAALSASPEVATLIAEARREDAKLLLDAYKGVLVLMRMLDKAGLVAGASAADQISKRIVDAHPEFPGMASLRALKETTHD